MINILVVATDKAGLEPLTEAWQARSDVKLTPAQSGAEGLELARTQAYHLAVIDHQLADMPGLDLIPDLLRANALTNVALISPLEPGDFHEATEGLGVLAQLPIKPQAEQADELIDRLKELGLA